MGKGGRNMDRKFNLKEQVSMFKSGTLTAGIDEDDDAIFAELLGKTVDEETGIVTSNVSDEPIYVGFGHIVPKLVNGKRKYKVEFFPKMKFRLKESKKSNIK